MEILGSEYELNETECSNWYRVGKINDSFQSVQFVTKLKFRIAATLLLFIGQLEIRNFFFFIKYNETRNVC